MAEPAKLLTRKPALPPDGASVQSWQMQMRQAMFEALDADAVRDIVAGLVEKARKGDLVAARLILTYAVGSPTVQVKHATITVPSPAPLPAAPSKGLPRSGLKFADMEKRAANGQPIFDARDARVGDGDED